MPLLLKFKKDLVKSFQYGGSTSFFATAGFNPVQRPVYNPGALLGAYAPQLSPQAGIPKEAKSEPFKLDFTGKGHNNDETVASDSMQSIYNKYQAALVAGVDTTQLEAEMAFRQHTINNAKNNSLLITAEAKKSALDEGKAGDNYVFQDGYFWGTKKEKGKDGKWTNVDQKVPAEEFISLVVDNKDKKDVNSVFIPLTYNQAFNKRNSSPENEYLFTNGDKVVSEILASGMGNAKANSSLDELFAGLGGEDKSKLINSVSKANGATEGTMTSSSYEDNINNLNEVQSLMRDFIDPKIKNAVERQAWLNIPSDILGKAKDLPADEKSKLLDGEFKKQYINILSAKLGIRRKTSEKEGVSMKTLVDKLKNKADSGDAGDALDKIPTYVTDLNGEDFKLGVESFIASGDGYKNLFIKQKQNVFTVLSATKAESASNWLGQKITNEKTTYDNMADDKKSDSKASEGVSFNELNDKGSPFAWKSLQNAVFFSGDKINEEIKNRSIVDPNATVDIVYLPVNSEGKTIIESENAGKMIEPLKTYKTETDNLKLKLNNKGISEADYIKELKALTTKVEYNLEGYKMKAFHKVRMVARMGNKDQVDNADKSGVTPKDFMSASYADSKGTSTAALSSDQYNNVDSMFDHMGVASDKTKFNTDHTYTYDALLPLPMFHEFFELQDNVLTFKTENMLESMYKKNETVNGGKPTYN